MVEHFDIQLPSYSRGFHLITEEVLRHSGPLPRVGLMNIFIHHTSAGLCINENADPTVLDDFERIFNHLVPENLPFIRHTIEGSDDMPAHIKASMVGSSVSIPIKDGRLALGIWQGIYLCEFRNRRGSRKLTVTISS